MDRNSRKCYATDQVFHTWSTFVREAATEPAYRLWSVDDDHPAMVHVTDDSGAAVKVEVWAVIGFNAVLAAVATYELVAADLRLALLASMASTWFFSFINRSWPSPALASGFVLTVWLIMLLGWLNPKFNAGAPAGEPELESEPEPKAAQPPAPVPGP